MRTLIPLPFFVAACLALAGAGCTVPLEANLEPEEDVLAVYGLINCLDSSSWLVIEPGLSFTEAFQPDNSQLEGPATARLLVEGALWAEFRQEGAGSRYVAGHLPPGLEQREWELVVSHPRFGEGRAKGQPPRPGALLSARLLSGYLLPDGGRADNVLEVAIQDLPGAANYYELALLNGPEDSLEVVFLPNPLLFAVNDSVFSSNSSFAFADRWLFSDGEGDGGRLTLAFSPQTPRGELRQPWLNIRYVSQAYYNYMKSLADSGQEIFNPFQGNQASFSSFDEPFFGVFALYAGERVKVE